MGFKKNFILVFTLFTAILGGTACGQSPFLNHDEARDDHNQASLEELNQSTQGQCALSFPQARLCASLTWTVQPGRDTTGAFTLRFWNSATGTSRGPFESPANTVAVRLWMPSMGHGSSPVTVNQLTGSASTPRSGEYEATGVYFVMPGAWDIHVLLKDGARVVEEAILPITI